MEDLRKMIEEVLQNKDRRILELEKEVEEYKEALASMQANYDAYSRQNRELTKRITDIQNIIRRERVV